MQRPRAVIDIGTNSVRLLVAKVQDGFVVPLLRALHQPRLGRSVDRTGRLDPAAAAATLAAVGDLAARARRCDAKSVTVVGTSALRDAADRQAFIDAVRRQHDLRVTLLDGTAEAALSFYGAVRGTDKRDLDRDRTTSGASPATAQGGGPSGNVYVLDVGGGSTELVYGTTAGEMLQRGSTDVGAVRMTEQCIASDPPSGADWHRLEDAVRSGLEPLGRYLHVPDEPAGDLPSTSGLPGPFSPDTLIAVGGTATTLAATDLKLTRYDPEHVHGHRLVAATVTRLLEALRYSTVAERRLWPGMHTHADIIVAGAFIVEHVMRTLGAEHIIVSESDLLEGIVLREAAGEPLT